ncbi:MFS transporter [Streptomyces sp. NPDC020875]|uniref:MFS transporter n=1 Tax=Streptomyces sp. NPDC020875 TaxID=3154898 RepID=UPI00340D6A2D
MDEIPGSTGPGRGSGPSAPPPAAPGAGRPGTGAALALLASTQLLLIMDTAIINVALPSIGKELGSGSAGLSWVANAFLITFGGLLLLGGRTADLLGHRRLYLAGLGVLVAASAAGAVAGGTETLIAARAAQGAGAALAAAAAFAQLLTLFPAGPGRHRALGIFAAMGGLGGVTGTVLGGVLTDLLSWRATFWLNVVVGLALAAGALRLLTPGDRRPARGFDPGGALTATAGLGLLAYALVGAGETGWTAARTLGAAGAGLALLAVFAVIESRIAHPLVPPKVLRRPVLRGANLLSGLAQMALFPMFFLVSLYLQDVLDQSPLAGGLGLLPLSLVVVAVAPRTGALIARLGLLPTMTLGFGLLCAGLGWLALALRSDGTFFSTVFAPSLLLGVALPLVMVTTNVAATADAAPDETGLASGLVNTSQQFGSVLGLAVLVAIATAGLDGGSGASAQTEGFRNALLAGAGIAALAALLSVRLRTAVAGTQTPGPGTPSGPPPPPNGPAREEPPTSAVPAPGAPGRPGSPRDPRPVTAPGPGGAPGGPGRRTPDGGDTGTGATGRDAAGPAGTGTDTSTSTGTGPASAGTVRDTAPGTGSDRRSGTGSGGGTEVRPGPDSAPAPDSTSNSTGTGPTGPETATGGPTTPRPGSLSGPGTGPAAVRQESRGATE